MINYRFNKVYFRILIQRPNILLFLTNSDNRHDICASDDLKNMSRLIRVKNG